jgi:SAM-dependent methyltransferase
LSKNKKILIKRLFSHLEGIVVIPTFLVLNKFGIIKKIKSQKNISLNLLSNEESIQTGYLNVALTTLSSLNILKKTIDQNNVYYNLTEYGSEYIKSTEDYLFYSKIQTLINNFIANDIKQNDIQLYIKALKQLLDNLEKNLKNLFKSKNKIKQKIAHHIEGAVLAPLLIYNSHNPGDEKIETTIKKILSFDPELDIEEGYNYFSLRAKSYGVTASYQPIFSSLDKIIFEGKNPTDYRDSNNNELHVNRRLNVWGSGGAHKIYFDQIDEIIIDIFNKPIEEQPQGIADMGCGDGMFLKHLYQLILDKTLRGKQIEKYPLIFIGADLNQQAIEESRKNLDKVNINCNFLIADISNPDKYKQDLKNLFNIKINNLLHVRSFLDHNRVYKDIKKTNQTEKFKSTGAYSYKGRYLSPENIASNLIGHFKLWENHIRKHGLLLLELHGLDLQLAQGNISLTPTIAYESTHGYSDQYIVEYDFFLKCALAAGLKKIDKYSKVFPSSKITTISLNIFK